MRNIVERKNSCAFQEYLFLQIIGRKKNQASFQYEKCHYQSM